RSRGLLFDDDGTRGARRVMVDPSAWDVIAEERIRAAQAEGRFDDLPGFGRPIPDLDRRDPNWWIKRKLKAEGLSLLPPVLEAKLARERTLERLAGLPTEAAVRETLTELNEQIGRALVSPLPGPSVTLRPVDVEATVREWRLRRRAS
ncbi:MAG TPA: DUF1992 domain-containing protein, partial [Planctomycetaceae bacterium]